MTIATLFSRNIRDVEIWQAECIIRIIEICLAEYIRSIEIWLAKYIRNIEIRLAEYIRNIGIRLAEFIWNIIGVFNCFVLVTCICQISKE